MGWSASCGAGAGYSGACGGSGSRSYSGHSSTSASTGISPTSEPPANTRSRRASVTEPIGVARTSQRAHTASTLSRRSGSTTHSIRSWDSETITSKGSMPGSRRGTRSTSMSIPTRPLEAISDEEDDSPAAPRSWSDSSRPRSRSSRQHSSSFFSSNGSPIWTLGRLASSSPSSALASTEAPPMPSRPVSAPRRTTRLPTPAAALLVRRSRGATPRHMALIRQLCSYGASK